MAVTHWYDTKTFEVGTRGKPVKDMSTKGRYLGLLPLLQAFGLSFTRQVYLYNIFQHKAIQSELQNVKTLRV